MNVYWIQITQGDVIVNNILLVGTGNMGKEYSKVLTTMNTNFNVIGRGLESAESFRKSTGVKPFTGGLEANFNKLSSVPTHAIVAVGDYDIYNVATFLLSNGIKRILLEKPGGTSKDQIWKVASLAKTQQSEVFVAYNRRFYASVEKALEIIDRDGGVRSFSFEFTEWIHLFENRENRGNIEQILYGNSGHVIDLAFFLGGFPTEMSSYISEKLSWNGHNRSFSGAGVTDKGALFSYQANWDAPGRWGVEIMTENYRLIFRPIEELHIQKKRSIQIDKVELDNRLDLDFKPGLYKEVESFINGDSNGKMVTIDRQLKTWDIFTKIEGYI